jgi:hypothetical protein
MLLLRRVGDAFRGIEGREWALLALETLGVVVGILVAFELNEWASSRSQTAQHNRLMQRLHEESEIDLIVIRSFRDDLAKMLKSEQAFAVELAVGKCPADQEFQAITTLPLMPALTVPTSVYQEMMGAGGLSSIDRKDVRETVAQFYGNLEWTQRQIDYFRSAPVKPLQEDDARVITRFDPKAEEPEVSTFNGRALCKDQGFRNRVASATRAHTVFVSFYDGMLENAISMCVRLGDSVGEKCTPPYGGPLKGKDAQYAAKVATKMAKDKKDLPLS